MKLDFRKIQNFCASKDIKKMKLGHRMGENIFTNYITYKRLVSRTYKIKNLLTIQ